MLHNQILPPLLLVARVCPSLLNAIEETAPAGMASSVGNGLAAALRMRVMLSRVVFIRFATRSSCAASAGLAAVNWPASAVTWPTIA